MRNLIDYLSTSPNLTVADLAWSGAFVAGLLAFAWLVGYREGYNTGWIDGASETVHRMPRFRGLI